MKKEVIEAYDRELCPVIKSIQELGDRWTMLILRECFFGVKKFDDFQVNLKISRSVLTKKLSQMLQNGLVKKSEYKKSNQRSRSEYILTDKGRELLPLIAALINWGNKYKVENGQETITLIDKTSKKPIELQLLNQSGEQVTLNKVDIKKVKKTSILLNNK